jgi:monofunctional biosynthetic peptidoglycan transglycosylase
MNSASDSRPAFKPTTVAGVETVLCDFNSVNSLPAWQCVNDAVMGGVSTSCFEPGGGVAVFRGVVSLENNGGFASVRSSPARHNVAGCDRFVLRLRGDGQRYQFTVRAAADFDPPLYQCAFATRCGVWQETRLAFRDFAPTFRGRVLADAPPLNPEPVMSLGFLIADRQDGPFRLEIAWIKASSGKP